VGHGTKIGVRSRNRLDVHAYRCVGAAARNRQNGCVHHSLLRPVATERALGHNGSKLQKFNIYLRLAQLEAAVNEA
jgi:hypothetical protein